MRTIYQSQLKIKILNSIILFGMLSSLSFFQISCSKDKKSTAPEFVVEPNNNPEEIEKESDEKEELYSSIRILKPEYLTYPSINVIFLPKSDVQKSIEKVVSKGGKLIYDPNQGHGSSIGFFIAQITPDMTLDKEFIKSLGLKAAYVDHSNYRLNSTSTIDELDINKTLNGNIPIADVKIPELRAQFPKTALGEGVTVAVIDSGVDASHPAFQSRVVYWSDLTEQSLTKMTLWEKNSSELTIELDGKTITQALPEQVKGKKIYYTIIKESELTTQIEPEERKKENPFYDINHNQQSDNYLVLSVIDESGQSLTYFDTNANLQIDDNEWANGLVDFNKARQSNSNNGFVRFPSRNKTIQYPLLIEESSNKEILSIQLGIPDGGHGTHVAGIIAAQSDSIQGAAPKAKIMSLKVCSGITCTSSAILKGLVEAFYNPQGLIPDVVNISLGSLEREEEDNFNFLFKDLSAKFGTVFFISASNNGPGFRTLNAIGNTGPTVIVGAGVSRTTLMEQYNLDPSFSVPEQNLLFFSSVGPSYTGQMRPNIVAPGGAISSTPLTDTLVDQYNGTSMSSPLAAGSTAALISILKSSEVESIQNLQNVRNKKIKEIQKSNDTSNISLTSYSMAIREALQNGATYMPNLTRAQQGYGMINMVDSYQAYLSLSEKLKDKNQFFFDLKINNGKKSYDRSGSENEVQVYELSLDEGDGERSEEDVIRIKTSELVVDLALQEELSPEGKVREVKQNIFSLMNLGTKKASRSEIVVLGNARRSRFFSKRNWQKMKEGYTYLAHYQVKYKGLVVQNILDVVHKTYRMDSNTQNELDFTNVKIPANFFQRYQIYVDKRAGQLVLDTEIPKGLNGALYLTVYNTKGEEQTFQSIFRFPGNDAGENKIELPITDSGVWEITLATANFRWMAPTQYNLNIKTSGISTSTDEVMLAGAGDTSTIVVHKKSSTQSVKSAESEDLHLTELFKEVPLKSQHWTYVKLNTPTKGAMESTDVVVQIAPSVKYHTVIGGLIPKLYKMDKSGQKTVVASADNELSKDGKLYFKNVSLLDSKDNSRLYFAFETFFNFDEDVKEAQKAQLIFEAHYMNIKAEKQISADVSDNDIWTSVINLKAPESLTFKDVNLIKGVKYFTYTDLTVTSEGSIDSSPRVRVYCEVK